MESFPRNGASKISPWHTFGETFEHAVVKNVAPFGCFVDVGVGTDGLLHSSELRAHGGTLEVEARVRVVVKSVDVERGRLGLALAPA